MAEESSLENFQDGDEPLRAFESLRLRQTHIKPTIAVAELVGDQAES